MSSNNITLDIEYVRDQFPAFKDPLSSKWTFVENAGGIYVSPQDDFDTLFIGDQSGVQFTKTINSVINSVFNKINKYEFINIIFLNHDVIYHIKLNTWAYGPATIAIIIEEAIKYNAEHDIAFSAGPSWAAPGTALKRNNDIKDAISVRIKSLYLRILTRPLL